MLFPVQTYPMDDEQDDEDAAIMAVIDAESAAYFRNDIDAQVDCWLQTHEARWIWAGPQTGTNILKGFERIEAKFRENARLRPSNFDAREFLDRRNVQICRSGDMAWVYYDQGLKRNHPNFHTQTDQKELKILHRVAGRWKIAVISIVAPALMKEEVAQIRLSRQGEVTRLSQAGREKLPEFGGLVLRGKKVHAARPSLDDHLQADIATKLEHLNANFPPSVVNRNLQAVPLGTDDYSRPLYCWVFAEGDELVITFDAAQSLDERLDDAAVTFGLSPAQRRLAGFLVAGQSLADVADTQDVSVNTVKTHLRRMFEKTGTNDQASLLATLLSVARPIHGPPTLA